MSFWDEVPRIRSDMTSDELRRFIRPPSEFRIPSREEQFGISRPQVPEFWMPSHLQQSPPPIDFPKSYSCYSLPKSRSFCYKCYGLHNEDDDCPNHYCSLCGHFHKGSECLE